MAKKKKKSSKLTGKESWIWIVGALVVLLVAVSLFSLQTPEEVEEEPIPELPEPPVEEVVEEELVEEEEEILAPEPNPEITKLFAKIDQVSNYGFSPARYNIERGETRAEMKGKYWVKDDIAKIEVAPLLSMDGWSADYVYLDLSEESAMAYCIKLPNCLTQQISGEVDYEEFDFPRPESFIDQIQYGEIVTQRTVSNRPVAVIEWEENDQYWQAYVDTYYGLPVRIVAHSDADRTNIVSGWEFRDVSINSIKDSDVERPW